MRGVGDEHVAERIGGEVARRAERGLVQRLAARAALARRRTGHHATAT